MLVPKEGRPCAGQASPLANHQAVPGRACTSSNGIMLRGKTYHAQLLKLQVHPTALCFMAKHILLHHLHLVHFIPLFIIKFLISISNFHTEHSPGFKSPLLPIK